jgi:release factor glutamine methyltransferase
MKFNLETHTAAKDRTITRLEAEVLLGHVLNVPRSHLYAWPEIVLTQPQETHYQELLKRRKQGEPIAYLTGKKEFWSLELQITAATLIPRPETELLVELALARLSPNSSSLPVIDLGTGSGAIALAIATERPQHRILATDNLPAALTVAQANARRLGIDNIEFLQSDWFTHLTTMPAAIIVSNPPYLATDDPHWQQGDLQYEPPQALVAGPDGLTAIRHLIERAPLYLADHGWLLLEHGYTQGEIVRKLFAQQGYVAVTTYKDLAGLERVTTGKKASSPACSKR